MSLRRTSRRYLRNTLGNRQDFGEFLSANPAIASGLASVGGLLVNAMMRSEYAPLLQQFFNPSEGKAANMADGAARDIVDTAVAAGGFETLAAALEAAGLVEALKGKGPFTVFAPTDEAFAELPEGTLAELLKPANKEKLKGILLYHVVEGRVPSSSIEGSVKPKTLQGETLKVKARRDGIRVNDARVIKADVNAKNGIIHVIDDVLLPAGRRRKG